MPNVIAQATTAVQLVPGGAMLVALNAFNRVGKTLGQIGSHREELHDV
jgi:hypothetical protein